MSLDPDSLPSPNGFAEEMSADDPHKLRLFFAVEVAPPIRVAVDDAAAVLRALAPQARWTDSSTWHLTLAFLGWVRPEQVADVEAVGSGAATDATPFALSLTGRAGMFRNSVLWAGLEPAPAIDNLAADLGARLRAAGFELEKRRFHAHLTLARAPRGERLPNDLPELYEGPVRSWGVDRLLLMRSHLRRSGARYTTHASWPLGSAAG